jgi:restriction system protein
MTEKALSKTQELAARVMFAALNALKETSGQLPHSEVVKEVEKRLTFDDYALERFEKTGNTRWWSILHFSSIDCVKAGYLIKKKGQWYLTPEGEMALGLGEVGLLRASQAAFRKWRSENPRSTDEVPGTPEEVKEREIEIDLERVEQTAMDGLKQYIAAKNPYEFQELVAALLRGMGYHTPFVAPKGKDGGIDIVAYRDPLGTSSPRIKVQIKHRMEGPASVQEVRQLMGLLQKDGDVGLFVSSGGFTSDTRSTARGAHVHVELIDLARLIELWQEFYPKLSDIDKSLMPLTPIYFLAPAE